MRNLTSIGYELLLEQLNENSQIAAKEYETLRERLIRKFEQEDRGRYKVNYELLADDTLDRVAQFLEAGKEPEKGVRILALGIARIVWLNFLNNKENQKTTELEFAPEKTYSIDSVFDEAEIDKRIPCLLECLKSVPKNEEERTLIFAYYDQKNEKLKDERKKIIEKMGITQNNLSTKMCRLRVNLKNCIINCMEKKNSL